MMSFDQEGGEGVEIDGGRGDGQGEVRSFEAIKAVRSPEEQQ